MTVHILDATTGTVTERDLTPEEAAQRAADEQEATVRAAVEATRGGNATTLTDRALLALQANRDYLAIANPTTAQMRAQIAALTRQNNGIIRLLLNKLDGTD